MHRLRLTRLDVLGMTALLTLLLLSAGCAPKTEEPSADSATMKRAIAATPPASAPTAAQGAINSSQDMGRAMQEKANAQGDAMSKAMRASGH